MIFHKSTKNIFCKRFISVLILGFFTFNIAIPRSYAQITANLELPAPGMTIKTTDAFNPTLIKGANIYPNDPLKFDFIIDKGQTEISDEQFKQESNKLIKYFMASLTTPEDEMWVNLSPYEKDRIIPESFGKTEMGRDLLSQDYILKQLMSSLMSPENKLGEQFWERVYSKAQEQFGTTDIPLNTFNKVWIVASDAKIYEHTTGAFVVGSHLKVMLETDYLAMKRGKTDSGTIKAKGTTPSTSQDSNTLETSITSDVIRKVLIPELESEVNEGATFAKLRQIYNSMILATWYKKTLKKSLLGKIYVDKNKFAGVENNDPAAKEKIYSQYLESFKKGVFTFIKDEYDPKKQAVIPRKYFSGGVIVKNVLGPHSRVGRNNSLLDKAMSGKTFQKITATLREIKKTFIRKNPLASEEQADKTSEQNLTNHTSLNKETIKSIINTALEKKAKNLFIVLNKKRNAGEASFSISVEADPSVRLKIRRLENQVEKTKKDIIKHYPGYKVTSTIAVIIDKGSQTLHIKIEIVSSLVNNSATTRKTVIGTRKINILCIDDDPNILSESTDFLKSRGYSTTTANNGEEALKQFKASPEKFDIIITDLQMPFLTGYELAHEIKKIRPSVPIILATGKIGYSPEKGLFSAKINKPINHQNLLKQIKTAVTDSKMKTNDTLVLEQPLSRGTYLPLDSAMTANGHAQNILWNKKIKKGGIDLAPKNLHMEIQRNGNGVAMPLSEQDIKNINIDGFMPIIINIQNVTNLPMLLGLKGPREKKSLSAGGVELFDKKTNG